MKTINMQMVLAQSKMIGDVLEGSTLVRKAAGDMILALRKYDNKDTMLSNGELMALAAALVAQIVHTTLKNDSADCPVSDDEMRVAVGFAATNIECVPLN